MPELSQNRMNPFFSLLQSGLWEKPVDINDFVDINWQNINKVAIEQTVSGIIYDGLTTLPADLQPDSALLKKWFALVMKTEQVNLVMNSVLTEIWVIYTDHGLSPVLLKGQGLAQNYINPLRRQCGDIDIYIGENSYKEANNVARSLGINSTFKNIKHLSFNYKNVFIENHRIINELFRPRDTRNFNKMVNRFFPDNTSVKTINNFHITIPSVQFDALFILLHLSNHFYVGGIGLRQLCDWARFLFTHHKDIDINMLEEDLKSVNLIKEWTVFGYIVVHYLGLPIEYMPFYTEKVADKSHLTLRLIMKEGNFGFYNNEFEQRPKNYFAGKLFSVRKNISRVRILHSIFPNKIFWCYTHYIWRGIGQLFFELTSRFSLHSK